jgi:thioredoxin reductase
MIDAGAPRNAPAAHMQGFLSRDGTPPAELLALGRTEIRNYGVDMIDAQVHAIEPGFTLRHSGGGTLHARTVLLTTGATDDLPDIPGARERWGRDFLHCPYCHGWEVRDQPIGVLGTDPGSAAYAHLLRQWSDDVIFFAHTQPVSDDERAGLAGRGIAVVDGRVARFAVADDRLRALHLGDGRHIPRAAVFMRPTLHPQADGLIEALGCELDASGFVRADATGHTTVPGVWVAGNASNPRAQVITAAGEGSAAAIGINTHLVEDDIQRSTCDQAA